LKPKQALYGATETVGTGEDKSDQLTADPLDLNLQLALEKRNSRTTITLLPPNKSLGALTAFQVIGGGLPL
jgi:hypothetical protein